MRGTNGYSHYRALPTELHGLRHGGIRTRDLVINSEVTVSYATAKQSRGTNERGCISQRSIRDLHHRQKGFDIFPGTSERGVFSFRRSNRILHHGIPDRTQPCEVSGKVLIYMAVLFHVAHTSRTPGGVKRRMKVFLLPAFSYLSTRCPDRIESRLELIGNKDI